MAAPVGFSKEMRSDVQVFEMPRLFSGRELGLILYKDKGAFFILPQIFALDAKRLS